MTTFNVSAPLRYLLPGEERPIYIASSGGADAALDIGAAFDSVTVNIADARALNPAAGLDREGFTLVPHATAVENFYDLRPQQAAYEQEITDLVLAACGGSSARVFDHTLRSDSRQVRGKHSTREPAGVIHNDYTDSSATRRLQDVLDAAEAQRRLAQRFAIINVWRSIRGTVLRSPLALCDAGSAAEADFVASERRAEDRIGELQLVTYNAGHRWYYYPEQQFDEALLIKTFDSATDGRARRVAHTAFDNPMVPATATPRESIESRLLVFFDDNR
jgi:hypothetical protein